MSSGDFLTSKYETNAGAIHPIRVQPETLAAVIAGVANAAPTSAITSGISARTSNGNRQFGLKPRMVVLEFVGSVPAGYSGDNVSIPALTPAFFNAAVKGATGTYLGSAVRVASNGPERIR